MMEYAVRLKDVRKTLGGREILKGIDLDIRKGDIFGYLGPNGAGKTTTIRILLGLFKSDTGSVELAGEPARNGKGPDDGFKKIGFILDPVGLYNDMTAGENLQFFSRLYGTRKSDSQIEELLGLVGLKNKRDDKAGTFSKGMKQRLGIARALVHDPEILILDEPTSGIDPSGRMDMRQVILEAASGEGKTVFMSSHDLDEVQRICNRIALINHGEIIKQGELSELQSLQGEPTVTVRLTREPDDALIEELVKNKDSGFRDHRGKDLFFSETKNIPDIVSLFAGKPVNVEEVKQQKTSIEELYASIVDEAEEQE